MPEKLPPNVHVVLSTLPDVGGCLEALHQKYPVADKDAFYLEIPDLTDEVFICSLS